MKHHGKDFTTEDAERIGRMVSQSGYHPLAVLLACVKAMGWEVAYETDVEDVPGMAIGTTEFLKEHVRVGKHG